ncbi:MAG TPA: hypothetical protein VIQ62_00115, partial [Burkholderiales bacterium]
MTSSLFGQDAIAVFYYGFFCACNPRPSRNAHLIGANVHGGIRFGFLRDGLENYVIKSAPY